MFDRIGKNSEIYISAVPKDKPVYLLVRVPSPAGGFYTQKSYSTAKYGPEEALRLAVEYRDLCLEKGIPAVNRNHKNASVEQLLGAEELKAFLKAFHKYKDIHSQTYMKLSLLQQEPLCDLDVGELLIGGDNPSRGLIKRMPASMIKKSGKMYLDNNRKTQMYKASSAAEKMLNEVRLVLNSGDKHLQLNPRTSYQSWYSRYAKHHFQLKVYFILHLISSGVDRPSVITKLTGVASSSTAMMLDRMSDAGFIAYRKSGNQCLELKITASGKKALADFRSL